MNKLAENYLRQIKRVFPLEIGAFSLHESGDDFVIIEVNQTWMFRFPRNEPARKAMGIETDFLAEFEATSPLPIPVRKYLGEDFVGYGKIQGKQLTFEVFTEFSKSTRVRVAEQLGQFLSAVHSFPVEKAASIGIAQGWNGLHQKAGLYFLEHVTPLLSPTARKKAATLMERLLTEEFKSRVIHGDFYLPEHIFYDERRQELSGVIDFSDVSIYDPAHDWQCIVEIGGDEHFEAVMAHYQIESDTALLKRSKMRLEARPLFVAGNIFLNSMEEQYANRLARIEAKFG